MLFATYSGWNIPSHLLLLRSIHTVRFFAFLFVICVKHKEWVHSLHLTQHPIEAMVQFDANTNAHANVDASVNGPLTDV